MQPLARTVFTFYILALLWLVLFKFSYDFAAVLGMQIHTVNLVPFADYSRANVREMLYNFAVFIPFGLLLARAAGKGAIVVDIAESQLAAERASAIQECAFRAVPRTRNLAPADAVERDDIGALAEEDLA